MLAEVSVRTESEMGLLGLAFHPEFEKNGRLFLNYNPADGEKRTVVAEWVLSEPDKGGRATERRRVLEVAQPYPNHNAGQLAFGPDGYLYIGLGDGGWRADPEGHGQNRSTLLGSILRIDVDSEERPYAIPPDNPFVALADVRKEIWAYGARNPWRYSFDPHGRLVVADVGQDSYEEIDLVSAGDNLGWNIREATHCFEPKTDCPTRDLVDPVHEYGRALGQSVTGGYVYTGEAIPELVGKYVFADFTSGRMWSLELPGPHLASQDLVEARLLGQWSMLIATFGRDHAGELYVADYGGGGVYRLAAPVE